MKQTAVEWLVNMWEMQGTITPLDIREAKRIEKEHIEDAHIEGQRVFDEYPHTQWTNDQAEAYYKKTYNKK
jgi:hypothetical protein